MPGNETERGVNIFLMFTGVSLYAYMFSKLSTIFTSVSADETEQKVRTIRKFMFNF